VDERVDYGLVTPDIFSHSATLIGHRGLGKGLVAGRLENTLPSFLAALDAGIDWVEVDVRRTADDQLFVAHDAALADGHFLSEITGVQASRYGVPRVQELLEALPPDAGVAFDVKSSLDDAGRSAASTTGAMLGRIGKASLGSRPTVALSFDPAALRHIRDQLPTMPLGLLTWLRFPVEQAVAAAAHLDVQLLAIHAGSLWPNTTTGPADLPSLPQVVTRVHQSNRQLVVWCPTEDQAKSLVAAEVDALVVDDVPFFVEALGSAKQAAAPAQRSVAR